LLIKAFFHFKPAISLRCSTSFSAPALSHKRPETIADNCNKALRHPSSTPCVIWLVITTNSTKAMKIRNAMGLTLLLSVSLIGTAQADRGYYDRGHQNHGGHRGYYNAPQQHHNHGRNWGVPAAVLAITGLAIGAAAYQSYQPRPAYVYSAPPQPVAPPPDSGNWYFCNSSGNYYPYVRVCPEGWQPVAPPR